MRSVTSLPQRCSENVPLWLNDTPFLPYRSSEWIWFLIVNAAGIGAVAASFIGTAIPLLVTGGFHVDGFMDTTDALSSYREKEERLRILKDPHIGAFAVIGVVIYYLLYAAGYSE